MLKSGDETKKNEVKSKLEKFDSLEKTGGKMSSLLNRLKIFKTKLNLDYQLDGLLANEKVISATMPVKYQYTETSQMNGKLHFTNYRVIFALSNCEFPQVNLPYGAIINRANSLDGIDRDEMKKQYELVKEENESKKTHRRRYFKLQKCTQDSGQLDSKMEIERLKFAVELWGLDASKEKEIKSLSSIRISTSPSSNSVIVESKPELAIELVTPDSIHAQCNRQEFICQFFNDGYEISNGYPEGMVFPKSVTRSEILQVAGAFQRHRFPVLLYAHPSDGILLRSNLIECFIDSDLLNMAFSYITSFRDGSENLGPVGLLFDAMFILICGPLTPGLSLFLAAYKNDLYEHGFLDKSVVLAAYYSLWLFATKPFEKKQHSKLDEPETESEFDLLLSITEPETTVAGPYTDANLWVSLITKLILVCNNFCGYIKAGGVVLVQSPKHFEIGTALAAILQVMVHPEFRTIDGFSYLIEKDFVFFGHSFKSSSECDPSWIGSHSIIFLVFIDCVFQLLHQFPLAFEFNESLLIYLLDAVHSCRYSTFMYSCERKRKEVKETTSIWSAITNKKTSFINDYYKLHDDPLTPDSTRVILWVSYYLRHSITAVSAAASVRVNDMQNDECNLVECGIPYLDPSLWSKLQYITSLNLNHNCLVTIPLQICSLNALRSLLLSKNFIKDVPFDLVAAMATHLKDLVELDLSGNKIVCLPLNFVALRLRSLKLQNNAIYKILILPSTVEYVDISQNSFKFGVSLVEESFTRCTRLNTLDLSHNTHGTIPESVWDAKNLAVLNLTNCITVLPEKFRQLTGLTCLFLDNTQVSSLHYLTHLTELQILSASSAKIKEIDPNISNLQLLRLLRLNNNAISFIPPELYSLSALQYLNLSSNNINAFSHGMSRLTNLMELILNNNMLRVLPEEIGDIPKLMLLNCRYNQIMFLPHSLMKLTKCTIKLESNDFKYPPAEICDKGVGDIKHFLQFNQEPDSIGIYRANILVFGTNNPGKTACIKTLEKHAELSCKKKIETFANSTSVHASMSYSVLSTPVAQKDGKKVTTPIQLTIWDIHDPVIGAHCKSLYSFEKAVFIICWNLAEAVEDSKLSFWLQVANACNPKAQILLVGYHADEPLCTKHYLTDTIVQVTSKYSKGYSGIKDVIPLGYMKKSGLDRFCLSVESTIQSLPWLGERVPTNFWKLEQMVIECSGRSIPAMSWNEFSAIGQMLFTTEADFEEVTKMLRSYATILIKDPVRAESIVIFKPLWLFEIVKALMDLRSTVFVTHTTVQSFLLHLMEPLLLDGLIQIFEVAEIFSKYTDVDEGGGHVCNYLFPSLLQDERPKEMEKEWPLFTKEPYCARVYSFRMLPTDIFPKTVMRILSKRKKYEMILWKNGLFLNFGKKKLLIEQFPIRKWIKISIRSKITSKIFGIAIDSINTLLESQYVAAQLDVNIFVPCIHCYQEGLYDQYLFPFTECEHYAGLGRSIVLCSKIRGVRLDKLVPDLVLASLSMKRLSFDALQVEREIAKGSASSVLLAIYNGKEVAAKKLTFSEDEDDNRFGEFRREVWIMSGLIHANIVQLIGFCTKPWCIVSEFVPKGNLYDLINDLSKPLSLGYICRVAVDIAKGMRFLHKAIIPPIVHRDFKSPNVFLMSLNENDPVVAKVGDFGLSLNSATVKANEKTTPENPIWLAPEVLKMQQFTTASDVYPYGIVLWEMMSRKPPFAECRFLWQVEAMIVEGKQEPIPDDCVPEVASLITDCWKSEPDQRPSFEECLERWKPIVNHYAPNLTEIAFQELSIDESLTPTTSGRKAGSLVTPQQQTVSRLKKQYLHALCVKTERSIQAMIYIPQLNSVLVADSSGAVFVFDEATRELQYAKQLHTSHIFAMLHHNERLWTCGQDNRLCVWSLDGERPTIIKEWKSMPLSAMTLVDNVLWGGSFSSELILFDTKDLKEKRRISLTKYDNGGIGSMLYNNGIVWVGSTSGNIIRIKGEKIFDILTGHTKCVHHMVPVNDEVWSCSTDKDIRVWDAQNGYCISVLEGHTSRVFGLMVEESLSTYVWSCSWDKQIYIWDAQSKAFVAECQVVHDDAVSCLLNINNNSVWSASWDRRIYVWAPQEFCVDFDNSALMQLTSAVMEQDKETVTAILKELSNPKYRSNPLDFAITSGNIEMIEMFIEIGGSVNVANKTGWMPLHIAAKYASFPIIMLLLKHGASVQIPSRNGDLPVHFLMARTNFETKEFTELLSLTTTEQTLLVANNNGDTPLHKAAEVNNMEGVRFIATKKVPLDIPNDSGFTAADLAYFKGYHTITTLLIQYGATPPTDLLQLEKGFIALCKVGDLREIKIRVLKNPRCTRVRNDENSTPLHAAVQMTNLPLILFLLEKNADINAGDKLLFTPLHIAANNVTSDTLQVCFTLLEKGADVKSENSTGSTPLHYMLGRNMWITKDSDIANGKLLLSIMISKGADINKKSSSGYTPLHQAIAMIKNRNFLEIIRDLIFYKANVNAKDAKGQTPLHLAVLKQRHDTVLLLLQNNADPNIENDQGATPMKLATDLNLAEIIRLFEMPLQVVMTLEPYVPRSVEETKRSDVLRSIGTPFNKKTPTTGTGPPKNTERSLVIGHIRSVSSQQWGTDSALNARASELLCSAPMRITTTSSPKSPPISESSSPSSEAMPSSQLSTLSASSQPIALPITQSRSPLEWLGASPTSPQSETPFLSQSPSKMEEIRQGLEQDTVSAPSSFRFEEEEEGITSGLNMSMNMNMNTTDSTTDS